MVESIMHYSLTKIEDLEAHPENPREISEAAKSGLKYSLESFGDISGIVWNERNGKLVTGHQRVGQLRDAGARLDPSGALTIDDAGLDFAVRVVDWPEDKHVEAMMVANAETIAGRWTFKARDHIAAIRERNAEAFARFRMQRLANLVPKPPLPDVPKLEAVATVETDSVFRLGGIELRLGKWQDALADVSECDAVITDVPYSDRTVAGHRGNFVGRSAKASDIEYTGMGADGIGEIFNFYDATGAAYLVSWCSHDQIPWFEAAVTGDHLPYQPIVWCKPNGVPRQSQCGPNCQAEFGFIARRRGPIWCKNRPGYYVMPYPPANQQLVIGGKPVRLMRGIICDYSRPGDLIVDPCAGGATTLLAAGIEGRRAIGAEMDPETFAKAVERLKSHYITGAEGEGIWQG